jgi:prepilin-type processing-associated H-X9-DG protein
VHLYKQFKLDEPWDGPHNKKLLAKMPKMYAPVGVKAKPGETYYQAFVGKGAGFEPRRQLQIANFTDGTSNTIIVVEAGDPVPWTKPEDLPYVADQALPRLGGLFGGYFNALFADGSVLLISSNADPDALRAAITRAAGDVFDHDKLRAPAVLGKDVAADAELLAEENQRLKDALKKAAGDVARARDEIAEMKVKLARPEGAADPRLAELLKQHADLQAALAQTGAELDRLRAERARLLELLRQRGKPGKAPTP